MLIMRNKKKLDHAGFTMLEMSVTFVIMMLLLTLSVGGILAYQDYADYKRQNDFAQTLFSAAQTKLTGYSVRGQMEQIKRVSVNPVNLQQITTPNGENASESQAGEAVKQNGVYYLYGNKESYTRYITGEYKGRSDEESMEYTALYHIFEEFLFDRTILDACIAIEYDPETAQVYSVLYSDKCNAFTYTGKTGNGQVNISDRRDGFRSEQLLGYYGLE